MSCSRLFRGNSIEVSKKGARNEKGRKKTNILVFGQIFEAFKKVERKHLITEE